MLIKHKEAHDCTVYVNDTIWRLQQSDYSGETYFFEKDAALNFKLSTDFTLFKRAHKVDNYLSVAYCYQESNNILFFLN